MALALSALAGCGPSSGAHREAPSEDNRKPEVRLVAPEQKSLHRVVEQPGTIVADEMAALSPKVVGYVKAVRADIGKEVKPGEVLCELSVPELVEEEKEKEARVEQAKAEVTQAVRSLEVARSQGDEAKAGVGRAQAVSGRWELEDRRAKALVGRGVVDEQTVDEAHGQFKAAAAALMEAKARLAGVASAVAKAEADVVAARARRKVAEAERDKAREMVKYTVVRAPFAGVVTTRHVNTGDLVKPGGGRPLFQVARLDVVRVVVQVPEADAALVADEMPITLSIQALGGRPFGAKVTRSSWMLSPGARTLRVEADLENRPAGGRRKYRPGMYVHARLNAELPKAWALPASAVVKSGDVMVAYTVEDGKARQTRVEAGHQGGQFVQVFRWQKPKSAEWLPFTGKEQVVEKAAGLVDGQAVEVK